MAEEKIYRHGPGARIVHLLHMVAMIMVILSGFQILYPSSFRVFGTLGLARKIHFYGMYLIIFPMIFRFFYHVWVSGDVKKFFIGPKDISYLPAFFKYYLFIGKEKPWGHEYNPGQKMTYAIWPALLVFQAVTGFAIYWPGALAPVVSFFGGLMMLKLWHTVIAWIFVITVAIHLYLGSTGATIWDSYISMVTGYETAKKKEG